jgi:hypothetical protein
MSEATATVGTVVEPKPKKEKPPVIPTPESNVSGRKPLKVRFHVGKDFIRSFGIPSADGRRKPTQVLHLYPRLSEWVGRTMPDNVNPRSHDPECLKSPVAKKVEETIMQRPDDFYLANRGSTIIAESYEFDPKTGNIELLIADPENQGLADGATTDAVLAKVQTALAREIMEKKEGTYDELVKSGGKIPETLQNGRIHLEVFIGLDDRNRIASLVDGRNTSRQVRGWSMADFRGEFEFIKDILEAKGSEFAGKIGYEENSSQDVSILDVLAIATLFHPEFDGKDANGTDKAPVIAYANKGRMDARLTDENLKKGYKELSPLLIDILKLHDYVYANFEKAYDAVFGPKARLGRRPGVKSRLMDKPYELPLTGLKSNYEIPAGFVFPVVAALRALVSRRAGNVYWKVDPFMFFDEYGKNLVAELMEQVDNVGGNPNVAGKRKQVYTAIHARARLDLNDELEARREGKKNGKK